jgi:hypothetical protein
MAVNKRIKAPQTDVQWGNIELPGLSDQELLQKDWDNVDRNKKRVHSNFETLSKLKKHQSYRAKVGWNKLTQKQRKKRIIKTSDALWKKGIFKEIRKKQGQLISAGKKINHPGKGKKIPKKTLKKMFNSLKGKKKFRYPTYILKGEEKTFKNCKEASQFYNVKPDTISKWINKTGMVKLSWIKNENR